MSTKVEVLSEQSASFKTGVSQRDLERRTNKFSRAVVALENAIEQRESTRLHEDGWYANQIKTYEAADAEVDKARTALCNAVYALVDFAITAGSQYGSRR